MRFVALGGTVGYVVREMPDGRVLVIWPDRDTLTEHDPATLTIATRQEWSDARRFRWSAA